jgi:hypothetical protein
VEDVTMPSDGEPQLSLAEGRIYYEEVGNEPSAQTLPGATRARAFTKSIATLTVLSDRALIDYLATRGNHDSFNWYESTTLSSDARPDLADDAVELAFAGVATAI